MNIVESGLEDIDDLVNDIDFASSLFFNGFIGSSIIGTGSGSVSEFLALVLDSDV